MRFAGYWFAAIVFTLVLWSLLAINDDNDNEEG